MGFFSGGPAGGTAVAFVLACGLVCGPAAPVRGETITRRHLDAGRVQFSGVDLNGDGAPDAIAQDNINKTITYFLADGKRNLKRIDPLALPEDERRLIPDMLVELDLDGDETRDLLLYNREYLGKYADNETVLARLLAGAIYLGQAGDTYRDLNGCALAPEARAGVLERARGIVLRGRP
jgi:hypothetical protein